MYDSFYELKGEPFRLSPDHNMAFAHKRFAKARAYMSYAFMRAEGFVMVTGRPGTGKTTLVGVLKDQLSRDQVVVAKLVCTQLQADDLLKLVCYEFGVIAETKDKGELLQQLSRRLKAWDREGRRALLIVDEAQNLTISALEELRLLTNLEVDGRPLLQIFLLGQTELRDLILRPELEQVHQRLVAAAHLEPLERDETEDYVRHRLESVGWRGNPAISKAVYPLIFKFSEGIPRRINLICSRLFLHGAVEQKDRIGVADMRTVVQELQSEGLAAGSHFSDSDFQVKDEFEAPAEVSAPSVGDATPMEGVRDTVQAPVTDIRAGEPSFVSPAVNIERAYSEGYEAPAVEFTEIQFSEMNSESGDPALGDTEIDHHLPLTETHDGASVEAGSQSNGAEAANRSEAVIADIEADGLEDRAEAEAKEDEDTPATIPGSHFQISSRDARSNDTPVVLKSEQAPAQNERVIVGSTRTNADAALVGPAEKKDNTAWVFALLLLLSLGLVMWAATGFKLPFTFDGM